MKSPFPFCAAYGFALSLLILSCHVSPALTNLFVAQPATLGTRTTVWMNWHGVGCAFVGLVNAQAFGWIDARPRCGAALASTAIFGIRCVKNLTYSLTSLFTGAMWRHVIGCFIAAVASASYVLRADTASGASI